MSRNKEVWLPVRGYEGIYSVSNRGRVRRESSGRVLKAWRNKSSGFLSVILFSNNKGKNHYVHRLVAEAFHGTCPDGLIVEHINGDPLDNRVENLRYTTRSDNQLRKYRWVSAEAVSEIKERLEGGETPGDIAGSITRR